MVTRSDRNQTFDGNGNLISEQVVDVDVTVEATESDLHAKARQALTSNTTFLALGSPTAAQNAAQVRSLTRQVNALVRLLVRGDLLGDNTDT